MRLAATSLCLLALALLLAGCGAGESTSGADTVADPPDALAAPGPSACAGVLADHDRRYLAAADVRDEAWNAFEALDVDRRRAEGAATGAEAAVSAAERELTRVRGRGRSRDEVRRAEERHARALEVHDNAVARFNGIVDELNELVDRERAATSIEMDADDALRGCLAEADTRAWNDAVSVLEARSADAVRSIATTIAHCDAPYVWSSPMRPPDGDDFLVAGYVEDATNELHLSPSTCVHLGRVVADPALLGCLAVDSEADWACPPSATGAADALGTLAHEAQHAAGQDDEAVTECFALQTVDDVARRVGVADEAAARIGEYLLRVVSRPDEYWTDECRAGAELDLDAETPAFP